MFSTGTVADFLMDKDQLFARVNLDDDELRLYEQVHGQMNTDWPAPDLVIYLQAPIDVLMERLRRRDIPYERMIERNYLKSLVDAYTQYFYHYTGAPLLMVNAAEINFVDSDADFDMLLAHIRKIKTGRHFFNPPQGRAVKPVTLATLREMKAKGEKIACLTAYDYSFARLLDATGADLYYGRRFARDGDARPRLDAAGKRGRDGVSQPLRGARHSARVAGHRHAVHELPAKPGTGA